ncbi:hypothetical protein CHS0354_016351 [Potamilus streckersoni]|uniref:Ig-like domain-containing protein n=1 Tax=Potamilus streckersoni TaxID=2493646 RepID=A0AAE0SMJ8_9BIVA|nr:hypothetical protein CHS0354_016351 [Potamilus streckersoni]
MAGLRTPALAVLLCLYWHHVLAGTLFAVPGDDVFFNISITSVRPSDSFIALERIPDEKHKVMVFLDRTSPPDISGPYRGRINFTGNISQAEMNFWLYNVSIEDAGEFRVVPVGIRKVFGSQILAVAGRPDNPTIVERTIPQVNKDHVLECKTRSNSRPETNGFKPSFIWKRNDTILENNSVRTVQGETLIIRRLQREDRFDKYTCIAYDSDKLPSNGSSYYQIDPKYGPSEELTLDPSNKTYFVEEGFEMANITCSADCNPHCIFSWDGHVSRGAKLYLGIIDKKRSGIYRCTALNPVTNVSWTTALEVIITTEKNCSCLLRTCEDEACSLSDIHESGRISDVFSPTRTEAVKGNGFPEPVVYAAGAIFACLCLVVVFAFYKFYRIRLVKSCSTVSRPQESNVNFSPREGQESDEVSDDGDRYSTIDEVFPKEIVQSAETSTTSESFRKKRTSVRYTRQHSVSSRRTSSTVDSVIEEEIETPSSNCLQDNASSEETRGLIYIHPHFISSED